jgi:hypothetical protein
VTTVVVEARGVVTPERFARGMTIAQYLDFIGTPENLAREAGWWLGPQRHDFLRERDGQTFQSVPLAAFFTRHFEYLYHYTEFPRLYHKERLAGAMQVPRPGETKDEAWPRFIRDWRALQQSPFWWMWASAGIDEILSALHERQLVKETTHGDA